jgi:hypothetical protein
MNRVKSLGVLYALAVCIIVSGLVFSVYSFSSNVSFMVLRSEIPGTIFGLVFIFLGIRYFRSLQKFSKKINDSNLKFSWENIRDAVKKEEKVA